MKISESYGSDKFALSFELFPPKTPAGEVALDRHVAALVQYEPAYITCTYGAGGSTQGKTLDIVDQIQRKFGVTTASHLTCVGATVDELRKYLGEARDRGVHNIVALRGDPPQGETEFQAVEGGLKYANELVSLLKSEFPDFGIAVAGYPEVHREAPSAAADLANLARKVEAGAGAVITQLFYSNEEFFRFRDRYNAARITAPLVPGILPVISLSQIQRITSLCGAKLPQAFVDRLAEHDDADWQYRVGVEFATTQVEQLIASGIPGVHFYVLNKSLATCEILDNVAR